MTLHSIEIRNFQSLHHIDIEFGGLTVIVGASSSGKSALTRSIRMLYANRRGSDFITHGERLTTIKARTSQGTVILTRGKGVDDNAYTIIPESPDHPLAPQSTWKKLGGTTPPEVTEFLGIDGNDPVAFAGQFDKPYLLDEKAPEVARILGELTNVRVIFDAARESNRRKLSTSQLLKTRSADLETIREKIPTYRNVKAQTAALTEAERLITEARAIEQDIARLSQLIESHEIAEHAYEALSSPESPARLVIPDLQPYIDAHAELNAFVSAIREEQAALAAFDQARARYVELDDEHHTLEEQMADLMGGLVHAFEERFRDSGKTSNGYPDSTQAMMLVTDAAQLAADYVAEIIH